MLGIADRNRVTKYSTIPRAFVLQLSDTRVVKYFGIRSTLLRLYMPLHFLDENMLNRDVEKMTKFR